MSENEKLSGQSMAEEEALDAAAVPEKPAKSDKAAKAKKDAKPEKKSKPSLFSRIGKWFRELRSELKKVQWPTGKQVVNNTIIVIVCCIVVGVCIWVFDWLAGSVVSALLSLFGKG